MPPLFSSQKSSGSNHHLQGSILRTVHVSAVLLCLFVISPAQNIQKPGSKSDFTERSDLRIDSSTLGLNIQIPLGNYPGRAGNGLPVFLSYSSKVHQIKFRQGPGEGENYTTWAETVWGESTASGWTNSLAVPIFHDNTEVYTSSGALGGICGPPQVGCWMVKHVQITMPDGSTHDLRQDNPLVYVPPNVPGPSLSGTYRAVDGSQLRFEYDSRMLFLPNGSRYIMGDYQTPTVFLDSNGNKQTYNPLNRTWTDTMGRVIGVPFLAGTPQIPFNPLPGDSPAYILPGVGTSSLSYTFRWKLMSNALTDPSQAVRYPASCTDPNFGGLPGIALFQTIGTDFVCCSGSLFNPVVLAEIILPNNQSYKFTYNLYGEIDKIVYPSGGYERYSYQQVQAADWMRGIYEQANRGVVEKWVSPKGDGSDEEPHWHYSASYNGLGYSPPYRVSITAPDGSRTERLLHIAAQEYPFGFRDVRASRAYEELSYSSTNLLLRRTLTEWTASAQNGTYPNARDPQLTRQTEILLDTSGNALTQTTTNSYDSSQNIISTSKYDYSEVTQSSGQTAPISSIPSGALLRTDETTYLINDSAIDTNTRNAYLARNLVQLPSETRVIGPAGIVARSLLRYDENSIVASGTTIYWSDPATPYRGNVTTSSNWFNTTNSYLSTRAQYDQYGNVRKSWDARDTTFSNPTQVDYTGNEFAYPTTTTSAIPDSTGVHAANVSLTSTTSYDFNTGSIISSTDANNKTTTYSYGDVLNRVKTVTLADGGLTTYNYSDVPGSLYVEIVTKLTSSQSTYSYQFFDALGRPNRTFHNVASGSYITRDTKYDFSGRQSAVSNAYLSIGSAASINPSGKWTTTEYEDLGRIKKIQSPDNAKVETFYSGNLTLVKDQKGNERLTKSDGLGGVLEVWEIRSSDPASGTEAISFPGHAEVTAGYRTKYEYDTLGNLTKVTQGTQPARIFTYDSLGRMISANNPENGTRVYSYDNNSNLSRKVDARGVVVDYTYDAFNRNTSIISSSDSAGTPAINRYYDSFRDGSVNANIVNGKGRLWQTETSGTTATRTTLNSTDAVGRSTNQSQQFLNGTWSQPYATQRGYNFAGGVIWQIYPSGRIVNYTFDGAGRPASFTGNIGDGVQRTYATNIAYDEDSRLKEEQYGTQVPLYHKLHYNVRGQLYDIRLSTVSWATDEWNWNRGAIVNYNSTADLTCQGQECRANSGPDNNGNLLQSQHWIPKTDALNEYNWTEDRYAYDNLNRLTSVAEFHGSNTEAPGAQDFSQVYDYDRFGNRTINLGLTQWTSGNDIPKPSFSVIQASNRLSVPVGQSGNMHYDPSGNLDNDSYSSFGTTNGTPTRTYDSDNRLVVVNDANQQAISTYTFNGDRQRVRRKVYGVETWQVFGIDGELLAEYGSDAAPMTATKEYGYRSGELLVTLTNGDIQRLKRFVKNLYYNAFARDASATELQQQMDTLAQAGVLGETQLITTARSMARSLFQSSEYLSRRRTDAQYVTDLYNSYLQRGPDTSGLSYWVNNTAANGRGATLNAFEVCSEFATLASTVYGSSSGGENQRVEHFIQQFYYGALQRDPTGTEMQQQSLRLNNAAALGQSQVITEAKTIGGEIFVATNYNSTRTTDQYVTDLYEAFLQRAPDGPGLNYWVNNTLANGRAASLAAFQLSGEYSELAGTLYREAFWLVGDHLGTPRMVANKSGSLASMKRHDYLPFGEELGLVAGRTGAQGYSSNGQIDNVRQKFTSKERDVETNLDYFGERYYSSGQARFISADRPLADQDRFEPQSWNLYSYVRNNPLRYVDEFGDALIYASPELETISNALRAESTSYDAALKGFEGAGAPDLTIQYGDAGLDADGVTKATGVTETRILPEGTDGSNYPAQPLTIIPAKLKNATITIDNSEKNDKTKSADVLKHEVGHADDARRNPKTYSANGAETKRTNGATPHDKRPNEIVANGFRTKVSEEIKQHQKQMKEEEKQRKNEEKQRRKEEKEAERERKKLRTNPQ